VNVRLRRRFKKLDSWTDITLPESRATWVAALAGKGGLNKGIARGWGGGKSSDRRVGTEEDIQARGGDSREAISEAKGLARTECVYRRSSHFPHRKGPGL